MTDISGPFTDLATFINGSIDTTNLATSAKPVTLLGEYRTVAESFLFLSGLASGSTYLGTNGAVVVSGNTFASSTSPALISLNSSDFSVSGLTTRLRLTVAMGTNASAATINFTWGLYPVTFAGGAAALTATVGTVVSGSTVTRSAPAASSAFQDTTSDFAVPTTGIYMIGLTASGTQAANSTVGASVRLQVHHV